jgi:hypothetical protein
MALKKQHSLTVALLILFCGATFAQEQQQEIYPRQGKMKDFSWKTQRPRHEFQFGVGDHVMYLSEVYDDYYFSNYERNINWFGSDVYTKSRVYTPAVSATYHYRLLKWLSLGGYISYAGVFTQKINTITEEKYSCKDHFFAIAASVRFTYLNRKYVTLYSGLAVSSTWQFSRYDIDNLTWTLFRGQITAIGITVGNKWFGFLEAGYGNKGVVTAGFGYRFDSK